MACRYVTYLRVSTDRQGESGLGLESQRATVQSFAKVQGCQIIGEYVEVESGRKCDGQRPQLQAAMDRARLSGSVLLIARLDRLTRSVSFLCKLRDERIDFTACDFPDATKFTINILASVAEHEAETISKNTKAALAVARDRLALQGRRLGGPLGAKAFGPAIAEYRAMGQIANAEKAKARAARLAATVADIKARGVTSLAGIAAALNEDSIVTTMNAATRGKWHATSVARLLSRLPKTAA